MQTPIRALAFETDKAWSCRQIRRIRYLLRNFKNSLAGGLVDSGPAMQGPIYRSDRNVSQFRDQSHTAPMFRHYS